LRASISSLIAKLNSKGAAAMSDSISYIIERMENTAEWRRGKAKEFPDDSRNLEAADELERLAKEIRELDDDKSDVCRHLEALEKKNGDDADVTHHLLEWEAEELRAIGFRTAYGNGAEFLEAYCETFEEELQKRKEYINGDDDGVPSPSLDEQVENDETVKAAKRAYEEARAKAYAEARKRL
jgi:archaellum component FlaC